MYICLMVKQSSLLKKEENNFNYNKKLQKYTFEYWQTTVPEGFFEAFIIRVEVYFPVFNNKIIGFSLTSLHKLVIQERQGNKQQYFR